jgi:hypothetical protein
LYPPGDIAALSERVTALFADAAAGDRALAAARALCSPGVVAAALRDAYTGH